MILAYCEDDRLTDFSADWVAQSVFQEGFAEDLIGCVGEKARFKLALFESLLMFIPGVIGEGDNEAFVSSSWVVTSVRPSTTVGLSRNPSFTPSIREYRNVGSPLSHPKVR